MLLSFSTILHVSADSCNRILEDALHANHLTVECDLAGACESAEVRELIEQITDVIAQRLANGQPTYRWDDMDYDWPYVGIMTDRDIDLFWTLSEGRAAA